MIAGDDPNPWRYLADGTIVALERTGDVVDVTVELQGHRIRLALAGLDAIRYQPHDEPLLYELEEIAASEPDIRDAVADHGAIVITGGAGTLRLAYANIATVVIDGVVAEPGALADLARRLR
jgi:hypothetical protein